jgi:hypothetical protein
MLQPGDLKVSMYYTSPACTMLFFHMYASWSWEISRGIRVFAGYIRCNCTKAHVMCQYKVKHT